MALHYTALCEEVNGIALLICCCPGGGSRHLLTWLAELGMRPAALVLLPT